MSRRGANAALNGLAIVEMVEALEMGAAKPVDLLPELTALVGESSHAEMRSTVLYLAGLIIAVTDTTGFSLAALIDQERRDALEETGQTPDDAPPGLA